MANETKFNQGLQIGGGDEFSQFVQANDGTQFDKKDWRARIRPKKGGEKWAYGLVDPDDPTKEITDSVLKPLQERGGIVYPYTPDIFLQASVDYNESMQHGSNYPFYTYINSRPTTLPITGVFTANTVVLLMINTRCMREWCSVDTAHHSYGVSCGAESDMQLR